MVILLKKEADPHGIKLKLFEWFSNTRFEVTKLMARHWSESSRRINIIYVNRVKLRYKRLRKSDCSVRDKPINTSYLSFVDWVEFNDTLNDFCDHFLIHATISSRYAFIRRGTKRRIRYDLLENEAFREGRGCDFMDFTFHKFSVSSTWNTNESGTYKCLMRFP